MEHKWTERKVTVADCEFQIKVIETSILLLDGLSVHSRNVKASI